jgi:glycosyltransferase involved in cell wall biosynthesis
MQPVPKFSIIIPVYNRPEELRELLESLARQTYTNFEVLVVDDGSTVRSDEVVQQFSDKLHIQYLFKPNSGPGPSRNLGFEHARGEYFVVFDSDCIVPAHYLDVVNQALHKDPFDAWGGPDQGHPSFTPLQQAMAFTMSAGVTTGGIRGSGHEENFQPRSFNMGISRKVWEATGGFRFSRLAEDIELSIRMRKAGFRIALIKDAFVYHKRRTTLSQFFRQVANFGRGRVQVAVAHAGAIKAVHWLPALFLAGLTGMLVMLIFDRALFAIAFILLMMFLITVAWKAFTTTSSLAVALLSVPATLVQLTGYGYGFLTEWVKSYILNRRG